MSEEHSDNGKTAYSRRRFGKLVGGIVGTTSLSGVVAGDNGTKQQYREFKRTLVEKYGRSEANKITELHQRYAEQVESGKLSDEEALDRIIQHPQVNDFREDVIEYRNNKGIRGNYTLKSGGSVASQVSPHSGTIDFDSVDGNADWAPNGYAGANGYPSSEKIELLAEIIGVGSASAYVELYTSEFFQDGIYNAIVDYFRRGRDTGGMDSELKVFVGPYEETVETMDGYVQGNKNENVSLAVPDSGVYKTGVRFEADDSNWGWPNDIYADFFYTGTNGERKLEINNLDIS
jgi:hypothetical protein